MHYQNLVSDNWCAFGAKWAYQQGDQKAVRSGHEGVDVGVDQYLVMDEVGPTERLQHLYDQTRRRMDVSTFDSGSGRVDSYRCHAERYYNGLERPTEIEPLILGRVVEK